MEVLGLFLFLAICGGLLLLMSAQVDDFFPAWGTLLLTLGSYGLVLVGIFLGDMEGKLFAVVMGSLGVCFAIPFQAIVLEDHGWFRRAWIIVPLQLAAMFAVNCWAFYPAGTFYIHPQAHPELPIELAVGIGLALTLRDEKRCITP